MPAEVADPVVLVVDGDEQDVGLRRKGLAAEKRGEQDQSFHGSLLGFAVLRVVLSLPFRGEQGGAAARRRIRNTRRESRGIFIKLAGMCDSADTCAS
jgi:hypothetical protein